MKTFIFRPALLAMLGASAICAQNHQRFDLTDLGPVGAPPGQPFAVTNSGFVSGSAGVSENTWHAVLWFQGLKIDIGKPGLGGVSSAAFGVNEKGQTAGQAETAIMDPHSEDFCGFGSKLVCSPFVWRNGTMAALPTLVNKSGVAGTNAAANAINNQGEIAGQSENTIFDRTCPAFDPGKGQYQQFQFKPVIWENNKVQELPTVGGDPDGVAFSINDSGQAAGASGTCTSFQANGNLTYLFPLHATVWQNGAVVDLGNLGGTTPVIGTSANHINSLGEAVGSSDTPDGSFRGFLWTRQTGIQDLGTIGDDVASVALANNNRGEITGISFDKDFNLRAFLRRKGGRMVDLNSLIPADSPLFLLSACYIDSRGDITGWGVDIAGQIHGFLLTPSSTSESFSAVSPDNHSAQFDYARKLLRERSIAQKFRMNNMQPH